MPSLWSDLAVPLLAGFVGQFGDLRIQEHAAAQIAERTLRALDGCIALKRLRGYDGFREKLVMGLTRSPREDSRLAEIERYAKSLTKAEEAGFARSGRG